MEGPSVDWGNLSPKSKFTMSYIKELGEKLDKVGKGLNLVQKDTKSINAKVEALSREKDERPKLFVDKQAKVTFTLGGYEDKVVCLMVPMEVAYLLLGRPWQYDKRVIHDGVTNMFTFVHLGQTVVLKPLSRREVHEDKKMKVKRDVERKTESKLKKKREGE
ncbi:hypothetical protein CR513_01902, partial [Mucuna pruriens]